jgi:glycosyltransferase involved in cell wall biosynthesis
MKISVIIPSRLQVNPNSPRRELWLDRALGSVERQTVGQRVEWEIVVGLDPCASLPERLAGVRAVNAPRALMGAAINTAVAASSGEFLAILEDDDVWEPRRLEVGLGWIDRYDLVTTGSREVTGAGAFIRFFDFPTPCGWLLRRETWDRFGPYDESLIFHGDNEYLGRVTSAGGRRVHLVEADAPSRPWLENVGRYSAVVRTGEREPLVTRTANPDGSMGQIGRLAWATQQSFFEHIILNIKFGAIPW